MPIYYVTSQFAKANAPSFYTEGYEKLFQEAKEHFNMRSRLAANPKEILELSILDAETFRIVFSSENRLNAPQISRSLRVFSMYLIREDAEPSFRHHITGKRLFRMESGEIEMAPAPAPLAAPPPARDSLRMAQRLLALLLAAESNLEASARVREIETILEKWEENHHAV